MPRNFIFLRGEKNWIFIPSWEFTITINHRLTKNTFRKHFIIFELKCIMLSIMSQQIYDNIKSKPASWWLLHFFVKCFWQQLGTKSVCVCDCLCHNNLCFQIKFIMTKTKLVWRTLTRLNLEKITRNGFYWYHFLDHNMFHTVKYLFKF